MSEKPAAIALRSKRTVLDSGEIGSRKTYVMIDEYLKRAREMGVGLKPIDPTITACLLPPTRRGSFEVFPLPQDPDKVNALIDLAYKVSNLYGYGMLEEGVMILSQTELERAMQRVGQARIVSSDSQKSSNHYQSRR